MAQEQLAALRYAGLPAVISSARRSLWEQSKLVLTGASRTMRSAHLRGLAWDIDMYGYHPDQVPTWIWVAIGEWSEKALGLFWGGRWQSLRDFRHFELR